MTVKAKQLFLELCLLRLQYTDSDIEHVAGVPEVTQDPAFRDLIGVLKRLDIDQSMAKRMSLARARRDAARVSIERGAIDVRSVINGFAASVLDKKILRTREQLNNFARSIGVSKSFNDRQECVLGIKDKLNGMPPEKALQKIRSVDPTYMSSSSPFVDLAKTLMKS